LHSASSSTLSEIDGQCNVQKYYNKGSTNRNAVGTKLRYLILTADERFYHYRNVLTFLYVFPTLTGFYFFSPTFLPARRYTSAGTSYGPVSVCLSHCLSQVGVLSKRLNESSWFLAWDLLSAYPTLRYKEIQVCSKIRVHPLELCSKLRT